MLTDAEIDRLACAGVEWGADEPEILGIMRRAADALRTYRAAVAVLAEERRAPHPLGLHAAEDALDAIDTCLAACEWFRACGVEVGK